MGCYSSKNILQKNKSINILYLEDTEIHADLLSLILKNYINKEVNIIWADNIKAAEDYIHQYNFDLIFIDRNINGNLEGDNFLNNIVNKKLIDKNKIVVISATPNEGKTLINNDFYVKYITKPIDLNHVTKFINDML